MLKRILPVLALACAPAGQAQVPPCVSGGIGETERAELSTVVHLYWNDTGA